MDDYDICDDRDDDGNGYDCEEVGGNDAGNNDYDTMDHDDDDHKNNITDDNDNADISEARPKLVPCHYTVLYW